MKIKDIDGFFAALDQRAQVPLKVIITGGAAAIIFGGSRATQDIDFEIQFKVKASKKKNDQWAEIQHHLNEVVRLTQIVAQYSDDIDRWSSIPMPSKKSKRYKKIGKIEVHILDVGLWCIGKLTRYLATDIEDLTQVLTLVKRNAVSLAKLWGQALGISAPSPAQTNFRRNVYNFFDTSTEKIWGGKADSEKLKKIFLIAATSSRRSS
ncbi:MAG: hypothetical protein ACKVQC_05690 [Elusimicrobiota bacterium]